jgi:hypothetical protein
LKLANGTVVAASADGRATWVALAPGRSRFQTVVLDAAQKRLTAPPVEFANGLLLCTAGGPVYYASAGTGALLSAPFQLPLQPNADTKWLKPAITDSGAAIVASGNGLIHRLALFAGEAPQLSSAASADLKLAMACPPASVGDFVYVVARSRGRDEVMKLSSGDFSASKSWALEARVSDGPTQVGDRVVYVTENGNWMAFSAAGKEWEVPVPFAPLSGSPLTHSDGWICTSQRGQIFRVDPATGTAIPWNAADAFDLGEPLGTGATLLNRVLLLIGRDSTLYAVPPPSSGSSP